jgi:hypothetical protein
LGQRFQLVREHVERLGNGHAVAGAIGIRAVAADERTLFLIATVVAPVTEGKNLIHCT